MRITESDLYASGLPNCWAGGYEALRQSHDLDRAVRHTTASLNAMPAGYRWGTATALRLFPAAFYAATHRRVQLATAEEAREGLARLRTLPGFSELLRATTALALYGALDGRPAGIVPAKEAVR
ncbi:hypothetical protein [Streptomyces sp. NBC_00203]|uniref:hypothetical protein n=1 Tax=Streptomyces sp. NBC_00203 TaxID=2975680 RepID=UPI0032469500